MISKQTAKFLKSLQIKKFRKEHACFIVEGEKSVNELSNSSWEVREIYATPQFIEKHSDKWSKSQLNEVSEKELTAVSSFKSNNSALAVVNVAETAFYLPPSNKISIALESVNDPGNLGTIIRIADWYGIEQIYCSLDTVDLYGPKVISSTKGSFTRVKVFYTDLLKVVETTNVQTLGAFLTGESIYNFKPAAEGVLLVMGSESQGISNELEQLIDNKVTIPSFGKAESLNVSIATAILCDNLKR